MKYLIKVGNETLPISDSEIMKVISAMKSKSLVVIKAGLINGSFIQAITKDVAGEKGYNWGYKITSSDNISRSDFITDIPEKLLEDGNNKANTLKLK